MFTIHNADSLDLLKTLPENSVHAVVTDPPYGLGDTSPAQYTRPHEAHAAKPPPRTTPKAPCSEAHAGTPHADTAQADQPQAGTPHADTERTAPCSTWKRENSPLFHF